MRRIWRPPRHKAAVSPHQDRGPFNVPREDLPCIDASIARALLDQAVELLKSEFGYTVQGASKSADNNGSGQRDPADWPKLMRNILDGRDLHDSIVSFAASMVVSGIPSGAVERKLEALMDNVPEGQKDARWRDRRGDIPRIVRGAFEKFGGKAAPSATATLPPILSKAQFLKGFMPPDYLIDGMLQRRFIYSLTGQTGAGKTAVALHLAELVSWLAWLGPTFLAGHEVEKGNSVYFVGENPDDTRMRLIGSDSKREDEGIAPNPGDHIHFIPGVFDIGGLFLALEKAINDGLRSADLVIVDTSAAYFLKDDENDNVQSKEHGQMLRRLTTLPGGPCVLILCHPIKYVTEAWQLLPRGGGSFTAELDGNLTLFSTSDRVAQLHHSSKFRGAGFEPISFRMETFRTPKLMDTRGNQLPTVRAVPITEQEEKARQENALEDDDTVMIAMLSQPEASIADLCKACGWVSPSADGKEPQPQKSTMHRVLKRLEGTKPRLARVDRERWTLTEEGKKAARRAGLDRMRTCQE
jgi:hypothetical protein